jgi:hypothetical protein
MLKRTEHLRRVTPAGPTISLKISSSKDFFIEEAPRPGLSSHARMHRFRKPCVMCHDWQGWELDVQRWHGRIGDATEDAAAGTARYRVVLRGTPLDSGDYAAVHARLSQDCWAAELVRSALVYGLWPGQGQLWLPDAQATVVAGDGEHRRDGAYLQRRVLDVETRLPRDELAHRLRVAFFWDRLIDVDVEDDAS